MTKIRNYPAEIRSKGAAPRAGDGTPPAPGYPMTFVEIAKELGITHQGAAFIYHNAIRKLRKRPEAIKLLQDLMAERRKMRGGW